MPALKPSIDKLLQEAVAQGHVPGVAASVFDGDGTLYTGAFGERALGSGTPLTDDTVFTIFSMTKAITSIAAVQLVESGKLTLDSPAAGVIPSLGEIGVLEGFDKAGAPMMRPPTTPITLRHLLTHTAGFGYDIWNHEYVDYIAATGTPLLTSRKLAALQMPLLFEPSNRWNYGINTDWVGRLVEEASGQSLGEFLAEYIFEPLGMNNSGFAPTPSMVDRMAALHQRGEDGTLSLRPGLTPTPDAEFEMGGGGLLSTLDDYAKFARMILNKGVHDGKQFLTPESYALLSTNQMGDNRVMPLKSAIRAMTNEVDLFPSVHKTWSLAFMINEEETDTGRSAGSMGWAGLANTYYWIDPTKNIGGVFATQILPFCDEKSLPLNLDFEKSVYDHLSD